MIRCAYCELFDSFECSCKHKNFPNDEICRDFSLDNKRLDEVRRYVINEKIQELLIKYQDIDNPPFNLNDFKFADLSEYTESKDKS